MSYRKYQSVTNWFQNQRSLLKRRVYDQEGDNNSVHSSDNSEHRSFDIHPEPATEGSEPTSLVLPPAASHPSLALYRDSPVPHAAAPESFKHSPMRRFEDRDALTRPRRTRPEPYQLDALKKLFARNTNPSIEERGALALEIGM